VTGPVRLLLALEARRRSDPLRHPRPGVWAAMAFVAAVVAGGLWLSADSVRPDATDGDGAVLLGALVSAALAFQSYPILFRPADDGFLRRLGISARGAYRIRALRLLALAAGILVLVSIPYLAAGAGLGPALAVAGTALAVAWGMSLLRLSGAAWRMVDPAGKPGPWGRVLPFPPELGPAAPMVFAPLWPLIAGAFAGRLVLMPGTWPAAWLAAAVVAGFLMAAAGERAFARAAPRYAPRAGEMAYAPPPTAGASGLVIGRGIAAVLPRRAGAVRARDAAVVARRYRWAARAAWPVAIVASLAVLRAGDSPAVRGWAVAAAAVVLALQASAVLSLGRLERGGTRWLDRAAGIRPLDRLVGRWAAGFGLSLGVVVPLALAWLIVLPPPGAALWLAAGAATAAVAATASVALAGR
jgi:hypothetical protein